MKHCELMGQYSEYYCYIMGLVGGPEWWDEMALQMARLFNRKYYWVNPLDENLAIEAEGLRKRFEGAGEVPDGEMSVLEVLIQLALDVDEKMMSNPKYGSRAAYFFGEILGAAGLDVDISCLDEQIDAFLDGNRLLSEYAKPSQTLWMQANVLFGEQFDVENESFQW